MPSPFPGMDPYLERPQLWRDVHHELISAIRRALAPQVAPRYYVAIDQRSYTIAIDEREMVSYPEVSVIGSQHERGSDRRGGTATLVSSPVQTVVLPLYDIVREGYIEIRDAENDEMITAVELLSPTNKAPGEGRGQYEAKRGSTLESRTNLVEIDLLRGGRPMAMDPMPVCDYRILVAKGWGRPEGQLYAFSIRDAIPTIGVPLREGETEPVLSLGALLSESYDTARYQMRTYYHLQPPEPPRSAEDAAWVDALLRSQGLRADDSAA